MLRSGQYSLAYFFVESFWIALAVCFSRYFYLYAMDLRSPNAWGLMLSFFPAMFFMSVSVGGLFNFQGMWAGAGVGALCILILGLALVVGMLNR